MDRKARFHYAACSVSIAFAVVLIPLFFPPLTSPQETACAACHEKLIKGKVVHQALQSPKMGCRICHLGVIAKSVPHLKTNTRPRGLSKDQSELCYGCHDDSPFTRKNVHPAIGMGCTSCHNPHSSNNDRLLVKEQPDLCYGCHEKGMFAKGGAHPSVDADCTVCHTPHSSDGAKLLK